MPWKTCRRLTAGPYPSALLANMTNCRIAVWRWHGRSSTSAFADPSDAATAYWHERARTVKGRAPCCDQPDADLHGWSSRLLQHWTLSRLDRPRFKRCVDLGCGRGEWSALFAPRRRGVRVRSPSRLSPNTRAPRRAAPHLVACRAGDLRSYQIPPGVDLAYFGAVLLICPTTRCATCCIGCARRRCRTPCVHSRVCTSTSGVRACRRRRFSIHRRRAMSWRSPNQRAALPRGRSPRACTPR